MLGESSSPSDESLRPSISCPPGKKIRRCYICPRKKDRKARQICELCKRSVCKDHAKKKFTM